MNITPESNNVPTFNLLMEMTKVSRDALLWTILNEGIHPYPNLEDIMGTISGAKFSSVPEAILKEYEACFNLINIIGTTAAIDYLHKEYGT